jgi:hypothetical protein
MLNLFPLKSKLQINKNYAKDLNNMDSKIIYDFNLAQNIDYQILTNII